MARAARKFAGLLLVFLAIAANQLQIPMVACQEEEDTSQCLPRKTFFAFLRLPEVSSNLAAYSRTARIIQDARNDFLHLKVLGSNQEDADDGRICLPFNIYYELFSDPTMRAHLGAIERAQRMIEYPESGTLDAEKRSLATLAKNDDLPISVHDREPKSPEDEEKRSQASMTSEELLKVYDSESQEDKTSSDVIDRYTLPNGELDVEAMSRDYHNGKRNIGALARDYSLPDRQNIASLVQELGVPKFGKRNVGTLARDRMIPTGKRTWPIRFGRYMWLKGKRNIGSIVRDYVSPPNGKRNIGYMAKNGWLNSGYPKRNVGTLARDWNLPQTRQGRSPTNLYDFDFGDFQQGFDDDLRRSQFESQLVDVKNQSRGRRQIDYSEEYPLPVMQNTNVFDYDDILDALGGDYPVAQKRFMGAGTTGLSWQDDDDERLKLGYHGLYQPSKRHIGALARLGWLPTFRSARFSRSPRYLVDRENSADGTTANNTPDSSTRLGMHQIGSRTRFVNSHQGDCRHGFKRYLLIPTNENYLERKLRLATLNI